MRLRCSTFSFAFSSLRLVAVAMDFPVSSWVRRSRMPGGNFMEFGHDSIRIGFFGQGRSLALQPLPQLLARQQPRADGVDLRRDLVGFDLGRVALALLELAHLALEPEGREL